MRASNCIPNNAVVGCSAKQEQPAMLRSSAYLGHDHSTGNVAELAVKAYCEACEENADATG